MFNPFTLSVTIANSSGFRSQQSACLAVIAFDDPTDVTSSLVDQKGARKMKMTLEGRLKQDMKTRWALGGRHSAMARDAFMFAQN